MYDTCMHVTDNNAILVQVLVRHTMVKNKHFPSGEIESPFSTTMAFKEGGSLLFSRSRVQTSRNHPSYTSTRSASVWRPPVPSSQSSSEGLLALNKGLSSGNPKLKAVFRADMNFWAASSAAGVPLFKYAWLFAASSSSIAIFSSSLKNTRFIGNMK